MIFPKPKNYPKEIYINDETYKVRLVKRIPGEPESTKGLCDWGKKIIYVRIGQSPKGLLRTLLHEVLHTFECEWDIKISHKQVYDLEVALASFLMDNF